MPEVITFVYPVSELWLYACSCGSSFSYTLILQGYEGPEATGVEIATASRPTTRSWEQWRITAPEGTAFRSVKLTASTNAGSATLVLDDLEWDWVE